MNSNTCRLVPLGGLGEIGKNMLALDCAGTILIIDAGLAFPTEEQPGIDLIIPDITYLLQNQSRILGVVLTHGHEDHVGALPYLLKQLPIPVYGTRMTLGMVRNKLEEHGLLSSANLVPIAAGEKITIGPFQLDIIRVTHSIVDGVGLGITTPAGVIVHTGDFKIDHTPVDGKLTDLQKFAELGKRGVDLLLADSTNVERPGYTLSEREVGVAFEEIIRDAPRRVVIACFSSNIHRFQQVVNACQKFQRKLGVLGMSMIKNMRTAQDLGYLDIPANLWLRSNDIAILPPEKTVILTTGSQGEPRSALTRAAVGENADLQLVKDDAVIVSARTIPGNERRIWSMINHLFQLGCRVHYERVSEIHVSGHGAQEELKIVHNLVKPRYFIPVHGEIRHLIQHGELACSLGMPADHVLVIGNGDQVELSPAGLTRVGKVVSGNVFVDGKGVGDVGTVVLRDRQHLAQDGMVVVIVGIDRQTRDIVNGPHLIARGIADEQESKRLSDEAVIWLQENLAEEPLPEMADTAVWQDRIRSALKRHFKKKMMRFPMIIPVIIET